MRDGFGPRLFGVSVAAHVSVLECSVVLSHPPTRGSVRVAPVSRCGVTSGLLAVRGIGDPPGNVCVYMISLYESEATISRRSLA